MIGLITGSGTYALDALEDATPRQVETRFGTAELTGGRIGSIEVLHVARHGAGHVRLSNLVNHRAHVAALRSLGAHAVLGTTVCGALDPELRTGELVVFDDLFFLSNRLGDGSLCTLYDEPGAPARGHWIFERPFSEELRRALLAGAASVGREARAAGCYGHVDGPRFNTRAEVALLARAGVAAISQTAGPESVLCGEAELPYALLGFVTDHANGVKSQPTPVEELARHVGEGRTVLAEVLAHTVPRVAVALNPVGTVYRCATEH